VALLDLDPDQLLSTTRAVRMRLDFTRPVPDSLIRECAVMALQAPSGSNVVTMQLVVVRDQQKRRAIGAVYRAVYERPLVRAGWAPHGPRCTAPGRRRSRTSSALPSAR
jgi:nitroreductase